MALRIGEVAIRKRGKTWLADYRHPATNHRVRRAIPATSRREAEQIAHHLNQTIASGKGFLPDTHANRPTVREAIRLALGTSHARDAAIRCYLAQANQFLKWLGDQHPEIVHWDQLNTPILQEFIVYCEHAKVAYGTLQKRWYVIRATSRYMADTYNDTYRDVARPIRIARPHHNPFEDSRRREQKALSHGALAALLDSLKANCPAFHAIVSLQALASLRAMEALHLREQDVDWAAGTIRITETPHHTPKNEHSYREIPVVPEIIEALKRHVDALNVRDPRGYLFITRWHEPWHSSGYSRKMATLLSEAWRQTGIEQLRGYQGHWLRSTFVTAVRTHGADSRVVQAYIGHAPVDMMGAHYEIIAREQFTATILPAIRAFLSDSAEADRKTTCATNNA